MSAGIMGFIIGFFVGGFFGVLTMALVIAGDERKAIDMAIEALSAEAVQGEWKIDEYGIYHCPYCHAINNTVYKSFCPNCGARMTRRE